MGRAAVLFSSLAALVSITTACGVERQSTVLGPTSGSSKASSSSSSSMLGTWVSATSISTAAVTSLPALSTCANFQWQVTSQTAASVTGQFSAVCPGGLNVTGTITGQLGGATIPLVFSGLVTQGSDTCAFTLNGVGVPISADTFKITFTGTSCLGPFQGAETLRLASSAGTPAPAPAPTATPTPAPAPGGGGDQVDLHQVTVLASAPDVASWPVTSTITAIDINASGIAVAFTKKDGPGRWPDVVPSGWDGGIEYTLWLVVSHGGQLYTAGGIEYWYGLVRSGGPPSMIAQNWYYSPAVWGPLSQHQPAVGELVGFFVTAGDQRAKDVRKVTERSNVVIVRFPGDGGAYYPF
jgi:hypothetical protein